MTKKEFCDGLRREMHGLPQQEIDQTLHYYSEIIADRMEEGMTEEQAVAMMEPMHIIARRVMADVRPAALPRAKMSGLMIALVILGFPLWFPLMATGITLVVVGLVLVWVLVLTLWALCLGLSAGGVAAVIGLLWGYGFSGLASIAQIGLGLSAMGLAIFLFYGAKAAVPMAVGATTRMASGIKNGIIRRKRV